MAIGFGGVGGNSGKKKKPVNNSSSQVRKLTESHMNQINVLRAMAAAKSASDDKTTQLHLQIEEIIDETGIDDEKEIQRVLFILEGQRLVAPYPEGDFTSRIWRITLEGKKALRSIEKAFAGE